mgnify:CR=1 FL=1
MLTGALGSPPRVRGAVVCRLMHGNDDRITPACAGSRRNLPGQNMNAQDHPRVCGEQLAVRLTAENILGSPPRVRGADLLCNHQKGIKRITPACAGSRFPAREIPQYGPDHPRVCGEQPETVKRQYQLMGSPPRVRGAAFDRILPCPGPRITPACAGSRRTLLSPSGLPWDHPRVCGEQ